MPLDAPAHIKHHPVVTTPTTWAATHSLFERAPHPQTDQPGRATRIRSTCRQTKKLRNNKNQEQLRDVVRH